MINRKYIDANVKLPDMAPSIRSAVMGEQGEPELLYFLAKKHGGNICELGSARGGGSVVLAHGLKASGKEGRVYTVSIWPNEAEHRRFNRNILNSGVSEDIESCVGLSKDWAGIFKAQDKKFNLIYIDADHSYKAVKQDILKYYLLLAKGGEIVFHDTNKPEVAKALEELMVPANWELTAHVFRIKAYKKK